MRSRGFPNVESASPRLCALLFSSPSFFVLFQHQPSTINISTIVCVLSYSRSGRTSRLLSFAEEGDVRAMALQVSALSEDLFVFLRLRSHYTTTLRATACCSLTDTAPSCQLFSSTCLLEKNAAHCGEVSIVIHSSVLWSLPFSGLASCLCHSLTRPWSGLSLWKLEIAFVWVYIAIRNLPSRALRCVAKIFTVSSSQISWQERCAVRCACHNLQAEVSPSGTLLDSRSLCCTLHSQSRTYLHLLPQLQQTGAYAVMRNVGQHGMS